MMEDIDTAEMAPLDDIFGEEDGDGAGRMLLAGTPMSDVGAAVAHEDPTPALEEASAQRR